MLVVLRPVCPAGFKYAPKLSRCYEIVLEGLNWTQSQARCPQLDPRAHLAVITSAAQNSSVVNYINALNSSGSSSLSAFLCSVDTSISSKAIIILKSGSNYTGDVKVLQDVISST